MRKQLKNKVKEAAAGAAAPFLPSSQAICTQQSILDSAMAVHAAHGPVLTAVRLVADGTLVAVDHRDSIQDRNSGLILRLYTVRLNRLPHDQELLLRITHLWGCL